MPRIYIVEDHEWAREALTHLLELETDVEVCGSAASAERALEELPVDADLVLVDLFLSPGLSGLDLVAIIRDRWPHLRCLVLSGQPAEDYARAATDAGAYAYIEKGDAASLLDAIRSAGTRTN